MAIIKTVKQSVFVLLTILLSIGCFFTVTGVSAADETEKSFEDLVGAANNDANTLNGYLNNANSPYLEKFDYVSLFDFNLGSSVEVPTGGEAFTNTASNTSKNIYAVSNQNLTGSVVFRFKYTWTNAPAAEAVGEKYNAQLRIKLRGTEWNGHIFKIGEVNADGTNSIQLESTEGSGWLGGTNTTFISGKTYEFELGAVDMLNSARTWVFVKLDGQYIVNVFADTLSYGTNRIDISTRWESSVKPADSEKLPGIQLAQSGARSYENVGLQNRFSFAGEMSSPTSLSLTMHDNGYEIGDYYPVSGSVVTYNGEPVSINTEPCLQKKDGTHYVLNLSQQIVPKENDKLKIEGAFLHYDAEHSIKQALATRAISFTFTGGKWVQDKLPFSELQSDAQNMLDEYLEKSFLALYDATEQETIKNIVAESKEAIATAKDETALNAAVAGATEQINNVKTSLKKYADEQTLYLNGYKSEVLSEYREVDRNEISAIKSETAAAIAEAGTKEEIDSLVAAATEEIDALKTDAEQTAEELAIVKRSAGQRIKDIYGMLDLTAYTAEEKTAVDAAAAKALEDIDAALTIQEVTDIVDLFENQYSIGNENNGGGGGCSSFAAASTVLFATVFICIAAAILSAMRIKFGKKHQ